MTTKGSGTGDMPLGDLRGVYVDVGERKSCGPGAGQVRRQPTPMPSSSCRQLLWEAAPPMSSLQMAIKSKLFEESLKTSENSHDRVKYRMLASLTSVFSVI